MNSEFDSADSTSGINKYMHYLYSETRKIKGTTVDKIEYQKISKVFPWANHTIFCLESRFTDFNNYDIIHNPNGLRLFARPTSGAKLVTTIHDLMPVTNRAKLSFDSARSFIVNANSALSDYVAAQGFRFAMQSDNIIVDIDYGKEEIARHFDYDKSKITTIRLAIDSKFILEPKKQLKSKKHFKIGYLGSFNATKNIGFAIRAVKQINDPAIKFELWGEQSAEAKLLSREIGIDKRIQFMGLERQSEKVQIFDSFDVFVHPGVYESILQFEALSRGIPVIVKKDAKLSPDLRNHCLEAKNEDEMAQIIEGIKANGYNTQKRQRAMSWARKFTWARNASEVMKVYKKVLE